MNSLPGSYSEVIGSYGSFVKLGFGSASVLRLVSCAPDLCLGSLDRLEDESPKQSIHGSK